MTYSSYGSYSSYSHYSKYGYGGYTQPSYTTYEFTAFSKDDLFDSGKVGCGTTFELPASATTCISVSDDDSKLSGDCYDQATDCRGQQAQILDGNGNDSGNGGQIYAEQYHWVVDQDGYWYVLIEIEQEGSNESYFTFHSAYGVPPAGASLTVKSTCNVSGDWLKYDDLGAGDSCVPTGSITGTAWCDDCDGIQEFETTITKGDPIFTHSVTYESVTCTKYNVDCYGDWRSTGCDTIDLVVGKDQGHYGNAKDNTIVELDKGGVWSRDFKVDMAGAYCLSFDTYYNSCAGKYGNSFDVVINGVVVETVKVTEDGKIELSVELKHGANEIEFVSKSGVSGYGAGIDDVNFQQLIETTTRSEPVKEGILIKLLHADGSAVLDGDGEPIVTYTDADGNYRFDDVPVGQYKIMGVAPDGTEFTIQNAGSDDSIDSDVDANGMSGVITVTAGGEADVDLGLCEKAPEPGSLSGRYFCDENRNDVDDGEPGIEGVVVVLLDAAGNAATDIDGNPVASILTAADGSYSFTNLAAGTYQVQFTDAVSGKTLVAPNVGSNDAIDSDAIDQGNGVSLIDGIVVVEGENTPDNDAGVFTPNEDPIAVDDSAHGCADELIYVTNLLANDSDSDGGTLSVTSIFDADETAGVGESLTLADGAIATLNADGSVTVDGIAAYVGLTIGSEAYDSFSYTVSDGQGGSATADVDVKFCGALNTIETIAVDFPTTGTFGVEGFFLADAYTGVLTNTGDARLDGLRIEKAYCLEINDAIVTFEPNFTVELYVAAEGLVEGAADLDPSDDGLSNANIDGKLDLINWIINQDFTSQSNGDTTGAGAGLNYTDTEVQAAIWGITENNVFIEYEGVVAGGWNGSVANANEILDLALANGEGFVPGEGDLLTFIAVPDQDQSAAGYNEANDLDQSFILAVSFDDFMKDCLC